MYLDNLTIAGVLMLAPYALLPLLFGREIWRIEEEVEEGPTGTAIRRRGEPSPARGATLPCQEA